MRSIVAGCVYSGSGRVDSVLVKEAMALHGEEGSLWAGRRKQTAWEYRGAASNTCPAGRLIMAPQGRKTLTHGGLRNEAAMQARSVIGENPLTDSTLVHDKRATEPFRRPIMIEWSASRTNYRSTCGDHWGARILREIQSGGFLAPPWPPKGLDLGGTVCFLALHCLSRQQSGWHCPLPCTLYLLVTPRLLRRRRYLRPPSAKPHSSCDPCASRILVAGDHDA